MKILFLNLLFLLSGCISIIDHAGNETYHPYNGTTDSWEQFICVWSREPTGLDSSMGMAYIKLTYLFWVVDFPLEIVSDTICFPYDLYIYYK